MLGFIILLLIFRYVKKIKIGDILDVEIDELQKSVNALIDSTDTTNADNKFQTTNINKIRDDLLTIRGMIKTIKAKAVRTT